MSMDRSWVERHFGSNEETATPPPLREVVKDIAIVQLYRRTSAVGPHNPEWLDWAVTRVLASAEIVALQQRVAALEAALRETARLDIDCRGEADSDWCYAHERGIGTCQRAASLLTAASDSASEAGK